MKTVYSNLYKKFKNKGNTIYLKYDEDIEFIISRKEFKNFVDCGQNSIKCDYVRIDEEVYENYFIPRNIREWLEQEPLEFKMIKYLTLEIRNFKRLNKYLKKSKGIVYQYALRSIKLNKKNWF